MKTIGIIGGSTDVSTAEYYKLLNAGLNKRRGGFNTGEIIINSMDFGHSARFSQEGLWEDAGKYLNGKALSLERAGADFIILACNTWHAVADMMMKDVNIPLLHIMDATGEAIRATGLTKVALVGTKSTMSSTILIEEGKKRYGVEVIVPTGEEQDILSHIILSELSKGQFIEQSKEAFLKVFRSLRRRGAGGVVLGCTEIPLLVKQADLPDFPMFDTLTLHVEAATTMALAE
jgi:aspartate racemase